MNWSPPPRCGKAAEAPLKNAPLQQLFHNVLVEIEIHLSLLCALNRSNSKTVPNFVGRGNVATFKLSHNFSSIQRLKFDWFGFTLCHQKGRLSLCVSVSSQSLNDTLGGLFWSIPLTNLFGNSKLVRNPG